jgi:hypothetical protein
MNNERVILIRGKKSNWYEQAIFIIKPGLSKDMEQVNIVDEAERIINEYREKKLGVRPFDARARRARVKTKLIVISASVAGALGFAVYLLLSHI